MIVIKNKDGIILYKDLTRTDLHKANLHKADLNGADLRGANLNGADLNVADLRGADFSGANLNGADLSEANLHGANLNVANLRGADLTGANLRGANLTGAKLDRANLNGADLSEVKGIVSQKKYLSEYTKTKKGIIVYKAIGAATPYLPPSTWEIKKGNYIEENVNPCRTTLCGCGVNFASKEWILKTYSYGVYNLWKCLIEWEDLSDIVVPYNTDGKARCSRLKLLEVI